MSLKFRWRFYIYITFVYLVIFLFRKCRNGFVVALKSRPAKTPQHALLERLFTLQCSKSRSLALRSLLPIDHGSVLYVVIWGKAQLLIFSWFALLMCHYNWPETWYRELFVCFSLLMQLPSRKCSWDQMVKNSQLKVLLCRWIDVSCPLEAS